MLLSLSDFDQQHLRSCTLHLHVETYCLQGFTCRGYKNAFDLFITQLLEGVYFSRLVEFNEYISKAAN